MEVEAWIFELITQVCFVGFQLVRKGSISYLLLTNYGKSPQLTNPVKQTRTLLHILLPMLSCEAKDLAMKQMGERADPIKTNLREI